MGRRQHDRHLRLQPRRRNAHARERGDNHHLRLRPGGEPPERRPAGRDHHHRLQVRPDGPPHRAAQVGQWGAGRGSDPPLPLRGRLGPGGGTRRQQRRARLLHLRHARPRAGLHGHPLRAELQRDLPPGYRSPRQRTPGGEGLRRDGGPEPEVGRVGQPDFKREPRQLPELLPALRLGGQPLGRRHESPPLRRPRVRPRNRPMDHERPHRLRRRQQLLRLLRQRPGERD